MKSGENLPPCFGESLSKTLKIMLDIHGIMKDALDQNAVILDAVDDDMPPMVKSAPCILAMNTAAKAGSINDQLKGDCCINL